MPGDDIAVLSLDHPDRTALLGRLLGRACRPGDVLLLQGDLGAGKTTLTGWIARGLGVPAKYHVTSPSFALLHEYPGRLPLFHMDCYRLAGEDDVEAAGLAEYMTADGVCVVEWPDRLGSLRPDDYLEIELRMVNEEQREATLKPHGRAWRERLPQLAREFGRAPQDRP